jgi:cyclophilin family peptidyl-prolyl cis-trans isomerase
VLVQLQEKYPDDVRLVFRHFPIPGHENAPLAHQAAEAAGKQADEFFYTMKLFLFEEYATWSIMTQEDFADWLNEHSAQLGLDTDQFAEDLVSEEIVAKISKAQMDAMGTGVVNGTPFVLINGQYYQNLGRDLDTLSMVVEVFKELKGLDEKQYDECPPSVIDTEKDYQATIETEHGDIVIELFAEEAPMTVNSFVFLAQDGWFDGVLFHRVLPDFVAQTGDPSGTGMGGPGYLFDNEINSGLTFDEPGMVGMANSGPNTNGSQFFITYASVSELNGGYTVFGKVIEGMDVAEDLFPVDPNQGDDADSLADRIITITIEEM